MVCRAGDEEPFRPSEFWWITPLRPSSLDLSQLADMDYERLRGPNDRPDLPPCRMMDELAAPPKPREVRRVLDPLSHSDLRGRRAFSPSRISVDEPLCL